MIKEEENENERIIQKINKYREEEKERLQRIIQKIDEYSRGQEENTKNKISNNVTVDDVTVDDVTVDDENVEISTLIKKNDNSTSDLFINIFMKKKNNRPSSLAILHPFKEEKNNIKIPIFEELMKHDFYNYKFKFYEIRLSNYYIGTIEKHCSATKIYIEIILEINNQKVKLWIEDKPFGQAHNINTNLIL